MSLTLDGSKSGALLLGLKNTGLSPLIEEFQQSSTVLVQTHWGNRAHRIAPAVRKEAEIIESQGLQWVG